MVTVLSRSMRPFLPSALLLCSVVLLSLILTAKGVIRLENGNVSDRMGEKAIPNGYHNANFGNGTDVLLPWYKDFLTLPSNVPWPGVSWLDRISSGSSIAATTSAAPSIAYVPYNSFSWKDTTYSSVYVAVLDNQPLQYPCRNFNAYLNSVFISNEAAAYLVHMTGSLEVAHYIMCYIRNFIGAMIVYYGTAGIFHYFCYVHPIAKQTFAHRIRPSASTIWNQISLAQASLFLYVLLPVVDEYAVEQGWTQTYHTVSEIGGYPWYIAMMIVYFALVEIGIYWMHRTLHTNKWLYKYIHMKHHQYNKPETLTPWASIAFHPLDGILQASPYFVVMFVIPCHYLTHVIMLFFTAIWATYIHDAMDWNIDPIMGSKYHTVHHTHYIYNYGQVFTFCDRIWGTLRVPLESTGGTKQRFLKAD